MNDILFFCIHDGIYPVHQKSNGWLACGIWDRDCSACNCCQSMKMGGVVSQEHVSVLMMMMDRSFPLIQGIYLYSPHLEHVLR